MQAYNTLHDPEILYKEAVRLYRLRRIRQQGNSEKPDSEVQNDGASTAEKSVSIIFEQAWSEIEQFPCGMNPYEFQNLVIDLLRAMEYHVSWISPPGKDGGVDIIAHTDPLGTQAPRIKIQAKKVGQKVDNDDLRSFIAIVSDNDVGIYVSTAGFTRDAEKFARSQERRKITLIDLERLVGLWIKHYLD